MAGVSFSSLNVCTFLVANSKITKNSTPIPMRPQAIRAPMESPAARPSVPSNMLTRVAQRENSGTKPMPVAEMSMKMRPLA